MDALPTIFDESTFKPHLSKHTKPRTKKSQEGTPTENRQHKEQEPQQEKQKIVATQTQSQLQEHRQPQPGKQYVLVEVIGPPIDPIKIQDQGMFLVQQEQLPQILQNEPDAGLDQGFNPLVQYLKEASGLPQVDSQQIVDDLNDQTPKVGQDCNQHQDPFLKSEYRAPQTFQSEELVADLNDQNFQDFDQDPLLKTEYEAPETFQEIHHSRDPVPKVTLDRNQNPRNDHHRSFDGETIFGSFDSLTQEQMDNLENAILS